MLDEKTKKELETLLNKLPHPVELLFFTQEQPCPYCREQQQVLEEIVQLSKHLKLSTYDFVKDRDKALKYNIDKIPATAIIGKKDYGIRFYGLTAGYEFTSLIESIIMVGNNSSGLSPKIEEMVKVIDQPVHIEVMVTLTCPYCPKAVHAAHQLAMVNDMIRSDMVESAEFPQLSQRYDVTATPKTIINETHSFVGAMPVESVYLEILKAVKPEEYKNIKAAIRGAQGQRHVRKPDPKNIYDTIIVGGGPSAMSAAIYAARKGLDVLLVADDIGGQLAYTASIENYLGLPNISGSEMAEQFLFHTEQFPIAESIGTSVNKVTKKNGKFILETAGRTQFTGHSIIYCTGKEYRKLGIPGEARFIGHGIAFCATCDAPLYKGKKVAVIGGGNSALTAVRDLVDFASEVHLVHRRDSFKADRSLVNEVKRAKNVKFHLNITVQEILGTDKLTGIRLSSTDGKVREDLSVDGVFLEIGLTPNTKLVKDLVKLNEQGEILVNKDNSTSVAGFFAAGDATDVPEKQIIIVAGEGAKAALTAYKYLLKKKFIKVKTLTESWE